MTWVIQRNVPPKYLAPVVAPSAKAWTNVFFRPASGLFVSWSGCGPINQGHQQGGERDPAAGRMTELGKAGGRATRPT